MPLVICPDCGVSITLPEGYDSLAPWAHAHAKTCIKGGQFELVTPKRKKGRKGKREPLHAEPSPAFARPVDPSSPPQGFVEDVTRYAAERGVDAILDVLFKRRK